MAAAVQRLGGKLAGIASNGAKAAGPKLGKFWSYAKVELAPPNPAELGKVVEGFNSLASSWKTSKYMHVTTKEAFINTLVCVEIAMWFYAGECIGKGSIIGYQIPGACDMKPKH